MTALIVSRVLTVDAARLVARTVRIFETRVEHGGRAHAIEEFLHAEETALDGAVDYAELLDRLRIYDEVWRTTIVLH